MFYLIWNLSQMSAVTFLSPVCSEQQSYVYLSRFCWVGLFLFCSGFFPVITAILAAPHFERHRFENVSLPFSPDLLLLSPLSTCGVMPKVDFIKYICVLLDSCGAVIVQRFVFKSNVNLFVDWKYDGDLLKIREKRHNKISLRKQNVEHNNILEHFGTPCSPQMHVKELVCTTCIYCRSLPTPCSWDAPVLLPSPIRSCDEVNPDTEFVHSVCFGVPPQ